MTPRLTRSAAAVLLTLGAASVPAAAQSPSPSPPPSLAAGDVVAPFDAMGVDGTSRHVDFPKGSHTVVLLFLSSCPVCHRMLPVWSEMYLRRPRTLNVIGIVLDREPPGFFANLPIVFPVVRSPGPELTRAFKIHHVPMTVRVGPGGKVEEVGEGILDAIRLGEIFRP